MQDPRKPQHLHYKYHLLTWERNTPLRVQVKPLAQQLRAAYSAGCAPTGDWEWLPELQTPTWAQPCACGWLPRLLVPTFMAFPLQGFLTLLQTLREPVLKHLEILHPVSPESLTAIHRAAVSRKVLSGSKVALGERSMTWTSDSSELL